jgi:AraC-like DNA-binding protein
MSVATNSGQRAAQWSKFTSEASSRFSNRLEFAPRSTEPFAPQMAFQTGDGVALSRTVMPALRITNHGNSRPEPCYQIACTDRDSTFVTERHGTLKLAPGEFVICKPEMAGEWTVDRPYTAVAIHIEERLVRARIPDPMALVAQDLELPSGLNEILVRIMDASIALSRAGTFGAASRNFACSFLHILALSPRAQTREKRGGYNKEIRRVQIKDFIQQNYAQRGLSIEDIAEHLGVTSRYLHMALAQDGCTPSEYLRGCRLLAARRLLSSAEFAGRSIAEIALECGFSGASHFSTQFRKRFGASPSSYRESALAQHAAPRALP